jgi:hypothetical protein
LFTEELTFGTSALPETGLYAGLKSHLHKSFHLTVKIEVPNSLGNRRFAAFLRYEALRIWTKS